MDNSLILVTKDYIFKHRTKRGAWTKAQILALGLKWPTETGWIDGMHGIYITHEQARSFEEGKTKFNIKKEKVKKQPKKMKTHKLMAYLDRYSTDELKTICVYLTQLIRER